MDRSFSDKENRHATMRLVAKVQTFDPALNAAHSDAVSLDARWCSDGRYLAA